MTDQKSSSRSTERKMDAPQITKINDNLIRSVSNESDFSEIKILNFHLRHNTQSKIQVFNIF